MKKFGVLPRTSLWDPTTSASGENAMAIHSRVLFATMDNRAMQLAVSLERIHGVHMRNECRR